MGVSSVMLYGSQNNLTAIQSQSVHFRAIAVISVQLPSFVQSDPEKKNLFLC